MEDEQPEMASQPDEAAGEPLDGPERDTETPEAVPEAPGGAEPVEPPVFTRADAELVSGLLLSGRGRQPSSGWSEAERQAEQRLDSYRLGYIDGECTHPEPPPVDTAEPEPVEIKRCGYGHTEADHEAAGACTRKARPYWLPKQVWLGIKVGEWPIQCFSNQEQAEHWAAGAKWEPDRQDHERRRIWPVDIPDGTQSYTVEKIPASTRLVEVTG